VTRNHVKRQLREAWTVTAETAAAPGRDYVLAARAGIAEPAATRGQEWMVEQVREALERVSA
jgi:RNase P protein component